MIQSLRKFPADISAIWTFLILFLSIGMYGCSKEPGFGGSSTVTGKYIIASYNDDYSSLKDLKPALDQEVYIQFEGRVTYADRERTNFDGSFEFSSLKKGKYLVFTYGEDSLFSQASNDDIPVITEFEITKNNQLIDLGEMTLINNNAQDGNSRIQGKVKVMNFNSDFSVLLEEYYAPDDDVWLITGDDWTYTKKVKTSFNGSFEFPDLCEGMYQVYIYGDDSTGQVPGGTVTVIDTVIVASNNETVLLSDLIRVD